MVGLCFKCSYCSALIRLDSDLREQVSDLGIIATIATCKKCGKESVVQLDSDETKKIFRKFVFKTAEYGTKKSHKQSVRLGTLDKKIKKIRKQMLECCKGTFVYQIGEEQKQLEIITPCVKLEEYIKDEE